MSDAVGNPEFAKLVRGTGDVDLVRLMLEFAADAYPDLDQVGCLLAIDELGVTSADCAGSSRCTQKRLAAVSRVLYEVEGFHGNRDDYYDPDNSYLNAVLARRCGIPISLGILYMAVAARVGLKTFGVNTPGHFVVGCSAGSDIWYVDPFTAGEVLDQQDCKRRIECMLGKTGTVCEQHFQPAAPLEIAARVLRNLKAAYAMRECWPSVLRVQRRLATLLPEVPDEQRDLGLVYLRLGEPAQALELLERYARDCTCEDSEAIRCSLQSARRMLAERN